MRAIAKSARLVAVPMKDPAKAKTRLKSSLNEQQRQSLATLLFQRTLEVLREVQAEAEPGTFDIAVVTNSAEISALARRFDCAVIDDGPASSLNKAARRASLWAREKGYSSLCILPADLAAPDRSELGELLSDPLGEYQVLLCPSADQGTNALLVSPPDAMTFCYGENSFDLHFLAAQRAGLNPALAPFESLKFDIDSSEDLTRLLQAKPDLSKMLEIA